VGNNIEENGQGPVNVYTKDQRTVFVSQLVQRANDRALKKYFKKQGMKVREVIMLKDKRGQHKGCAYVELVRGEDVVKAIGLSNQVPDFQRFPILVKPSEAEKNHVATKAQTSLVASQVKLNVDSTPLVDEKTGAVIHAQKVYVGGLSPVVTQEQLFVLFCSFGDLQKVSMQMDTATGVCKGFAFLQFRDPKSANLAIQSMNGQSLAGRPMKTGWASQVVPGANVVTSNEFPVDASARTQRAYQALAQLTVGVPAATVLSSLLSTNGGAPVAPSGLAALNGTATSAAITAAASTTTPGFALPGAGAIPPSRVPTVAEARAGLTMIPTPAPGVPVVSVHATIPQPAAAEQRIGNEDSPTCVILVHNMFGSDESADDLKEIQEEFDDETKQYGLARSVLKEGGKIYAQFTDIEGAKTCAGVLQGRWFDKRQLQVEFVKELPSA
jgi:RNA-binding protein 23/39